MRIFGDHEPRTIEQLQRCVSAADGSQGVLCADGHVGYSQPIGGVVAYKRLDEVLAHHAGTVRILHRLRPVGVAMAGADTFDPYKD
jgi:RNA-splicing ligase RtcB